MTAGAKDRQVQIRRGTVSDDGFQSALVWNVADPTADNLEAPIWAARRDVSDSERAAAGWIEATMVSRFIVWADPFSRGITPKDRLVDDALVYDVIGIKLVDRAELEITAIARVDL